MGRQKSTRPVSCSDEQGQSWGIMCHRLLEGGYLGHRAVADIVAHARTSRKTFFEHFLSKDECYVELLRI